MVAVQQIERPAQTALDPKGPPRPRWTEAEEDAWELYFRGKADMPKGRTFRAAIQKIQPEPLIDLGDARIAHATSMAAMRHLPEVSYKREGAHRDFVLAVQAAVERPWTVDLKGQPTYFLAAVKDARQAAGLG